MLIGEGMTPGRFRPRPCSHFNRRRRRAIVNGFPAIIEKVFGFYKVQSVTYVTKRHIFEAWNRHLAQAGVAFGVACNRVLCKWTTARGRLCGGSGDGVAIAE